MTKDPSPMRYDDMSQSPWRPTTHRGRCHATGVRTPRGSRGATTRSRHVPPALAHVARLVLRWLPTNGLRNPSDDVVGDHVGAGDGSGRSRSAASRP